MREVLMSTDEIAHLVDSAPNTRHAVWRAVSVLRAASDDRTIHSIMCILTTFITPRSYYENEIVMLVSGSESWPYSPVHMNNIYASARHENRFPPVVKEWLYRREAPKFALFLLSLAMRDTDQHQRDEIDSMITLLLS